MSGQKICLEGLIFIEKKSFQLLLHAAVQVENIWGPMIFCEISGCEK